MSDRPFPRHHGDGSEPHTAPDGSQLERHLAELQAVLDDAADLTQRAGSEEFLTSRRLQNEARGIVVHLREVINRLPASFTTAHPDVPWRQITGMGNVTAHEYDLEVDWHIVWNALTRRFPELRSKLDL